MFKLLKGFVPGVRAMVVAELLRWRVPAILILIWVLLGFIPRLSQDEDCLRLLFVSLLSKLLLGKDLDALELFVGAQEVTAALRSDFWRKVSMLMASVSPAFQWDARGFFLGALCQHLRKDS